MLLSFKRGRRSRPKPEGCEQKPVLLPIALRNQNARLLVLLDKTPRLRNRATVPHRAGRLRRRFFVGETPGEGSPDENSPPDCFRFPLLRYLNKKARRRLTPSSCLKDFAHCGERPRALPYMRGFVCKTTEASVYAEGSRAVTKPACNGTPQAL